MRLRVAMARNFQERAWERQPQYHGPQANQWRQGIAAGNLKYPPQWDPAMQHDPHSPCMADAYAKDVREWVLATEIPEERQGQQLILALSGSARLLFDGLEAQERKWGVDIPNAAGDGYVHLTAVEMILRILVAKFPVH